MPTGIQIFDANGVLVQDTGTRVMKFLGTGHIGNDYTGGTTSGTIVNFWFNALSGNVPFAFAINSSIDTDGFAPQFSFSGNTLTWSFPRSDPAKPWSRPNTLFAFGFY